MKFHNSGTALYRGQMRAATTPTLLARLRGSARLTVLVLVLMVLKIGAASACVSHEFAELGLGSAISHEVVAKSAASAADDVRFDTAAAHAATCQHCSCHHAAAVLSKADVYFLDVPESLPALALRERASAALRSELKPPII